MNGLSRVGAEFMTTNVPDVDWSIGGVTDMDGDGRTDDLVWRNRRTGEQSVWFMNSASIASSSFFTPTVSDLAWRIEGVGDSDGNGRGDLVWRNYRTGENSLWYMNGANLLSGAFFLTIPF
jgi:hypothetical protein